jgi:putative ABC transport system substrate-binding protein
VRAIFDFGLWIVDWRRHCRPPHKFPLLILALAIVVAPVAADAQSPGKPAKVGLLFLGAPEGDTTRGAAAAFRDGLRELGWIEGQNIHLEYRYAPGDLHRAYPWDQLVSLAADLAKQKVAAIVAFGTQASRAAWKATAMIPIIMVAAENPVQSNLVASLGRPGKNVTGLTLDVLNEDLDAKRLQLLKEALPGVSRVAVSSTQTRWTHESRLIRMEAVAPALGINIRRVQLFSPEDLDRTFARLHRDRVGALRIQSDPISDEWRGRIAELAIKHHLATMFDLRTYVEAGGLMSYGPSLADIQRRAATYVDKILKGAKPSDLPIEQPTKFDLVINLKTAKALGLTIPPALLNRADEVIQ